MIGKNKRDEKSERKHGKAKFYLWPDDEDAREHILGVGWPLSIRKKDFRIDIELIEDCSTDMDYCLLPAEDYNFKPKWKSGLEPDLTIINDKNKSKCGNGWVYRDPFGSYEVTIEFDVPVGAGVPLMCVRRGVAGDGHIEKP